jgi:hypothetical protein
MALATHVLKHAGRLLRARERGGSQTDPENPHRDNNIGCKPGFAGMKFLALLIVIR